MQLRSTSRKKRKAIASPETGRNNKLNQELEVSSHQVSGRVLEDDLDDESEAEFDSEENDKCSAHSRMIVKKKNVTKIMAPTNVN